MKNVAKIYVLETENVFKYILKFQPPNSKKYCVCDEGYFGDFCEMMKCNIQEEDLLFSDEESLEELKIHCPPISKPVCSDCPFSDIYF